MFRAKFDASRTETDPMCVKSRDRVFEGSLDHFGNMCCCCGIDGRHQGSLKYVRQTSAGVYKVLSTICVRYATWNFTSQHDCQNHPHIVPNWPCHSHSTRYAHSLLSWKAAHLSIQVTDMLRNPSTSRAARELRRERSVSSRMLQCLCVITHDWQDADDLVAEAKENVLLGAD